MLRSLTPLALLGFAIAPANAQCPSWSPEFRPAGLTGFVLDMVVHDQGDGPALYAGGRLTGSSEAITKGVARWDGATWSALGRGIETSTTEHVAQLASLSFDGVPRLCAVGNFAVADDHPARGVALWDGQQWDTLAGGPPLGSNGFSPQLLTAAVFDAGNGPELWVGGTVTTITWSQRPYIARWDGVTWTRVFDGPETIDCEITNPGCTLGYIAGLLVYDAGNGPELYAGGEFDFVAGQPGYALARFDGTSWTPVHNGFHGKVRHMLAHDDGTGERIYLGGIFFGAPHNRFVRSDGQNLSGVGAGPTDHFLDLVSIQAAAGLPAGLYTTPNRPDAVSDHLRLSRWDGVQWSTFDLFMGEQVETYALADFDGGAGNELFVGGSFANPVPGVFASNIARWDGAEWAGVGASGHGIGGSEYERGHVSSLCVHEDDGVSRLYAGGRFDSSAGGGIATVASWTGDGWEGIDGFSLPTMHEAAALSSTDLAGGPKLWIAGDLELGPANPASVAAWDGEGLQGYNLAGHDGVGFAEFDDGSGSGAQLYVATSAQVHRWSGTDFSIVPGSGAGHSGRLTAIATHDDGQGEQLYVAGDFVDIGGVPAFGVARWDGSSWEPIGAGLGDGDELEHVDTLLSVSGPDGPLLYAGGGFTRSGATLLRGLAVWDGVSWQDVGGGVEHDGGSHVGPPRVLSLAWFDDGSGDGPALYVGGEFGSVGNEVSASNLARFDGASWDGDGLAADGHFPGVRTLLAGQLSELGGVFLAAGGDFDGLGGVPAQRIAVLESCGVGASFCFGDGSEGPCPCGNESASGDEAGCLNSHGSAASLRAEGLASLADDSLELFGSGMLPNSPVLYFQAGNTHAATPFGDGLKCTGGPFVRLGTSINQGGASSYPKHGELSISARGLVGAPGTRHYQARYRDPQSFCTPATFNYTNALTIVWGL